MFRANGTFPSRLPLRRIRSALSERFGAARPAQPTRPVLGYQATLDQARDALRHGMWEEAEDALMNADILAGDDPAFFNLVGILHECHGRKRQARKFYGRAIALNGTYAPAQQNMRRLYELKMFGKTQETVALGDEPDPTA